MVESLQAAHCRDCPDNPEQYDYVAGILMFDRLLRAGFVIGNDDLPLGFWLDLGMAREWLDGRRQERLLASLFGCNEKTVN